MAINANPEMTGNEVLPDIIIRQFKNRIYVCNDMT